MRFLLLCGFALLSACATGPLNQSKTAHPPERQIAQIADVPGSYKVLAFRTSSKFKEMDIELNFETCSFPSDDCRFLISGYNYIFWPDLNNSVGEKISLVLGQKFTDFFGRGATWAMLSINQRGAGMVSKGTFTKADVESYLDGLIASNPGTLSRNGLKLKILGVPLISSLAR